MEVLNSMKKFKNFMSGKGYYIALILCAVAIGISGYLYYRNADDKTDRDVSVAGTQATGQQDVAVVGTQATGQQDVAVVGTQPADDGPQSTEPSSTLPVTTKPLQTVSPVEGEIVVVYAMESLGYNPTTRDWRTHNGIDIAAEAGTEVRAAADGTVYTVYTDETMGTTVVIRHEGGYVTCYASLDENVTVQAGDQVTMGQTIGCVGNTALLENAIGEHVHFSVTCGDVPVDPMEFLSQE